MNQHTSTTIQRVFRRSIGTADFETNALDAIRACCGGENALAIRHTMHGEGDAMLVAPFLSSAEMLEYNLHHAADNPYIEPINALPTGQAATTSSMLSIREFRKLPYFKWAMQLYGVYEIGAVVSRSGDDSICIGFSRSLGKGDFSIDQVARLQSLIAPFRSAWFLHRRLRNMSAWEASRVTTLVELTEPHYGCFAVNADGVIIDQNAAADEHLQIGSTVTSVKGRLRFSDPLAEQMLITALVRAATSASIPLPNEGTDSRMATLVRVDDLDLPSSSRLHAQWLVFLPALQQSRVRLKVLEFGEAHSLTDTEMRLLEHLVGGLDIRAIAVRLSHREETTRTILKHIFQKSGTGRQAELVARVLG